ncbi:hypothetical protein ACFYVD_03280 [Rhodococcus pyridinivorans]|uniref:hypothetical protein n=1 Tax=Rhodococcus pyridinivorans TaxID=103816 RepID=UPI00367686AA
MQSTVETIGRFRSSAVNPKSKSIRSRISHALCRFTDDAGSLGHERLEPLHLADHGAEISGDERTVRCGRKRTE